MALSFSNIVPGNPALNALNSRIGMGNTSASTPTTNSTTTLGQIGNAIKTSNNLSVGAPAGGYPTSPAPAAPIAKTAPAVPDTSNPSSTSAPPSVDMSGVPASAIAALSTGGLSGSALTQAQQSLAAHYASLTTPPATNAPAGNYADTTIPQPPTPPGGSTTGSDATLNPYTGSTSTNPTLPNNGAAPTGNYTAYTGAGAPGTTAVQTTYGTGSPGSAQINQGGTGTYGGIVGSLVNSSTNSPSVDQARNALASFNQGAANETAGVYAEPGLAEDLSGHAQAIQQANAQTYAGLQTNVQNALQEQSNSITGLSNAATAAKPTSSFPFSYNPLTGAFSNAASSIGGASGAAPTLSYNPQQDASTLAQEVISGSIPYSDAVSAMGYAPGVGTGLLQQAIVQGGGNIAQLEGQATGTTAAAAAPGQAAATNIGTAGTVGTTTAAQGVQQSTQAYVNANTAYTQATGQSANLQTAMQGINGINSQYANTAINALQGQFGSAKYTGFITSLNEAKQAYTNLLSSVGASTPTVNGQQATDIFNSASTPNQINAAISALNDAAYAKLKPLYDQIGTYQSQLNSGGSTSSTSSTSGGNYSVGSTVTTSAGGFTLTPNGWVSNPK